MERIKKILEEKNEIITIARLSMLTLVLIGVAYIAFLKDRSRETIFVHPDAATERIIVIDHIIIEANANNEIIQRKYESINYRGADADSLHRVITKYLAR